MKQILISLLLLWTVKVFRDGDGKYRWIALNNKTSVICYKGYNSTGAAVKSWKGHARYYNIREWTIQEIKD